MRVEGSACPPGNAGRGSRCETTEAIVGRAQRTRPRFITRRVDRRAELELRRSRACRGSLGAGERLVAGHDDSDLAGGASVFDPLGGLCGRGEWVGPVDDGRELAGLDELCYLVEGFGRLLGGEGLQGLPDEEIEDSGFDEVAEGAEPAVAVPV